jgi:hypothetical protein
MNWRIQDPLNGNPLDANGDGIVDIRDGLIIGATLQGLQQLDVSTRGSVGRIVNRQALDLDGTGKVTFKDGLRGGRAINHVFKMV